jgi:hypothetical protein
MTTGAYIFLATVWLSIVGLAALYLAQRSPKRRKPVDELEAADAALRNRMVDLEDKYESFVKRLAVRDMREKKSSAGEQTTLPYGVDRATRLAELRSKLAEKRLGGAV